MKQCDLDIKDLLRTFACLLICAIVPAGAVSLHSTSVHSTEGGYARHVWHTEDGLPEETVQAFAQTPDHFLWIGTSGGLVRFDGAQFVVFNRDNTPAFRENSVFSLLASKDGVLWVGTEGAGLLSYSDGVFRAWSRKEGLTNGYVRALCRDRAGDIWIGTDDGLFRLRGQRIQRVDGRDGVPLSSIHAIYVDRQQRVWAGGYHFLVFGAGNPAQVALAGGLTDNVKSILQTRDGVVWVGTVSGLQRTDPRSSGLRFERVRGIHTTVRTLLEDDQGVLWIGTIGEGLIRYRHGKFATLPAESKLPGNTVLSSFLGREKNIWIGTQTGLVRLNKTVVSTLALPDFADADFGTIYQDRDGALWVGSSHLFRLARERLERPEFPAPLRSVRVRTVFRDSKDALWLGTEGKGAFRWQHRALTQIPSMQPYVRAFAEDRQGGIWIGTDGGYCRWTPGQTGYFELHESVRALLVDRNGDVWVGKDRGLTRLRHGDFAPEAPIARLQTEKVWAIHEDPQGGLWFGTRGSGVFSFNRGRLSSYTTAQGLASNSIYQILEDRHGVFWISGPNGVSSVSRADLERNGRDSSYRPAVKLYGTSDGLETTQMYGGVQPAGCITSNGEVWFPSTAGPVRIGSDPDVPASAPPAVIYHVVADGRDVRSSGDVDLRPGPGRLEIQYSAIQLQSQDRVRFRYRLEGFDHSWIETRARRVVYANIPPGRYRFRLIAFDTDQPRTVSEAGVSLIWHPHVYQTRWFFALSTVCLGGIVWSIHALRIHQVHARFQAVLDERNRLAREMHDTLIQGCTSVSALLEAMASMMRGRPDSRNELLDHARSQIRETVDAARRAVWNLRQSTPETPGLDSLLERVAQQASDASMVPVRFEHSGKWATLDPLTEHDVIMVATEAVHNAVRHARPTEVRLQVTSEANRIALRVVDDGCGFDLSQTLSAAGEHFGLLGMRERIERLGGKFEVRSAIGKGTELFIDIPVHAAEPK